MNERIEAEARGFHVGDNPIPATQEQVIKCSSCGEEFKLAQHVQIRRLDEFVSQYILICPNCDEVTHCYYETEDIAVSRVRMRNALDRYQRVEPKDKPKKWEQFVFQRSVFRRLFKREQARLKKKYHVLQMAKPVAEN